MKKLFILSITLLFFSVSFGQKKETIHLWPGQVPGETEPKELPVVAPKKDDVMRYNSVTDPVFEVWLPEKSKNNGAAVVVCPGGGYNILAYDLEGTEIAAWLNTLGYSAFVLQYRVPKKRDGALQDAERAIRIVRSNAKKWNIDPAKVGIMGFSAGGSLSARTATRFSIRSYKQVMLPTAFLAGLHLQCLSILHISIRVKAKP
jgi:acetyl esterase/lipase